MNKKEKEKIERQKHLEKWIKEWLGDPFEQPKQESSNMPRPFKLL